MPSAENQSRQPKGSNSNIHMAAVKAKLDAAQREQAAIEDAMNNPVQAARDAVAASVAITQPAVVPEIKKKASYEELEAEVKQQRQRIKRIEAQIDKVKTVINNPYYRTGHLVEALPVGRAIGLDRVWHA